MLAASWGCSQFLETPEFLASGHPFSPSKLASTGRTSLMLQVAPAPNLLHLPTTSSSASNRISAPR